MSLKFLGFLLFSRIFVTIVQGSPDPSTCEYCAQTPEAKILDMVNSHPVLHHPYLERFSQANYADQTKAINSFATEHYLYSRNFQVYLRNVLEKIDDPVSMELLGENIKEENGMYEEDDLELMRSHGVNPDSFRDVRHPALMKRFVTEAEANPDFNEGGAKKFTDLMIERTHSEDACVGLAIMAFAIETTVSRLYQFIWEGLQKSDMNPWGYVFFPLHILIDDGHAEALAEAWKRAYNENPDHCYTRSYDVVQEILEARYEWFTSLEQQQDAQPDAKILDMVNSHPLLQHPYLKRFSEASYPDTNNTITRFATEHYLYSRNFQVYLRNVLEKIDDPVSMALLGENIKEENGMYEEDDLELMRSHGVNPDWFNDVRHPALMKRFVIEAEANPHYNEGAAKQFTDLMIERTHSEDACVGLAIMAFAIETTVSRLYQFIWEGLQKSDMNAWGYVFFPLHILIDDGHAEALAEAWKRAYNENPEHCYTSSYDVVKEILDSRYEWYNSMDQDASQTITMQEGIKEAKIAKISAWQGQGNTLSHTLSFQGCESLNMY